MESSSSHYPCSYPSTPSPCRQATPSETQGPNHPYSQCWLTACTRCVMYSKKCVHNGWRAACRTCVEARQKCSLSKALPPTVPINDSSLPVAGPSNLQPKVKIVIPRTMYAECSLPRKRVRQSPSPTPSEEASGDSPTPADLATTSHLPPPSHLLTDPPAASGTRRVLPAVPAEPRSKFLSFY